MPYTFIESSNLLKATGEPLRAPNELESSSTRLWLFNDQVVDLTVDTEAESRMKANKDSLMSALDAFVHDPLVGWEDEKRKMVKRLLFAIGTIFF